MAGLIKTSLHQSGVGQTSFLREDLVLPWDSGEVPAGRHLDRWARSAPVIPGITHAFMIVIPGTQLVAWSDDDPGIDTCSLMMQSDLALAVDVLLVEPTAQPQTLSIPDSVVFGRLATATDLEAVLVSRKLPWTPEDEGLLTTMKAQADVSSRTLTDPRPAPSSTGDVLHMRRVTMFGTGDSGVRFAVDAYDPRPLPGYE